MKRIQCDVVEFTSPGTTTSKGTEEIAYRVSTWRTPSLQPQTRSSERLPLSQRCGYTPKP